MSMMNTGDILETIEMFTQDNLDVRTVTMGISLLFGNLLSNDGGWK